jgi:DNA-binding response OmpR family regulator
MKPLILAVENDPQQAAVLRDALEAEHFTVQTFATSAAMLRYASQRPPRLFLLDIELPDMNGLDLCREIRQSPQWSQVPVIFASKRSSIADKVAALQLADDYICIPFGPRELVARVHAVLRRCGPLPARLAVGDLELDEVSRTVVVRGRDVPVTAQEFQLLAYLLKNAGRVFSRDQLLGAVWNARFVTTRSVDVYMHRLRRKVELQPDNPSYLRTLRGRGYRLAPPLQPGSMLPEAANHPPPHALPQYPQSIAA